MTTNHTPGPFNAPWHFIHRADERLIKDASGAWVATTGASNEYANLIASAPELLWALSRLLTETMVDKSEQNDMLAVQIQARAAITKATQ
jgi:hypothetical protein